jgi:hypothetical protein
MRTALKWLILVPLIASGAQTPHFADPLEERGFRHFYNLEYGQALDAFSEQAAKDPSSPDAQNHIATTILFREMFRAGKLDSDLITSNNSFLKMSKLKLDAADEQQFSAAVNRAISLAQERLAKNPNDTGAIYALGVSHGLLGNYSFVVRKAWRESLREVTTARKLHNRVTEIDPDFVDARLLEGLHDYVVGSLPLGWKLLGAVAGFHGDRKKGVETLKLVSEQGRINRIDAAMMLAAIYRREKKPEEAILLLNDLIASLPGNFLLRIELAETYGDLSDKTKALAVLAELDQNSEKVRGLRERLK